MADDYIRIGDAERDQAVARLQECHVEGRLTVDELDERLQAALKAKTGADIDKLFTDLPGGSPRRGSATEQSSVAPVTPDAPYAFNPSNPPINGGFGEQRYPQEPPGNNPWYTSVWVFWGAVVLVMSSRGALWFMIPLVLVAMIVGKKIAHSQGRRPSLPPSSPRQLTFEERDQVMREIAAGRKISAIKMYREITGADLRTAKYTIDAWARGIPGA